MSMHVNTTAIAGWADGGDTGGARRVGVVHGLSVLWVLGDVRVHQLEIHRPVEAVVSAHVRLNFAVPMGRPDQFARRVHLEPRAAKGAHGSSFHPEVVRH